jgi:hypothetical protein
LSNSQNNNDLYQVSQSSSRRPGLCSLHGKYREDWFKRNTTAAERFKYLYSERELRSLAKGFGNLEQQGGQRYAIFNNCYQNFEIMNAATIKAILRDQEPPWRVSLISALRACLPFVGSSAINVFRNSLRTFIASCSVTLHRLLSLQLVPASATADSRRSLEKLV